MPLQRAYKHTKRLKDPEMGRGVSLIFALQALKKPTWTASKMGEGNLQDVCWVEEEVSCTFGTTTSSSHFRFL